jgi:hypothetical protein
MIRHAEGPFQLLGLPDIDPPAIDDHEVLTVEEAAALPEFWAATGASAVYSSRGGVYEPAGDTRAMALLASPLPGRCA